jgi:hypothetical protein
MEKFVDAPYNWSPYYSIILAPLPYYYKGGRALPLPFTLKIGRGRGPPSILL